jgi:Tol biopolymer transport system component
MFGRGSNGRMLAVSPDGRILAFVARGQGGYAQLWVRPLDTLTARAMPGTDGSEGPFWSPDSASVGFFAGGALKAISVESREIRTICAVDGATTQATWNQAGVILFSTEARGVGGIARVSAAGGAVTSVTRPDRAHGETGHVAPYFLPDGEHFLYDVTANDGGNIYVGSLRSNQRTALLNPSMHGAPSVLGTGLSYTAPGYVLFVRDGTLMAQRFDATRLEPAGEPIRVAERVQHFGAGADAFSVSANGVLAYWGGGEFAARRLAWITRDGRQTPIPLPTRAYGRLALAPDDTRAAIELQASDATNIALVDLVRGTSTRITSDAFSIWPLWSPDGAHVIFSSTRDGMLAPYRQSVSAGENAQRLFDARGATVATDWLADGQTIVYASRTAANADIGVFSLSGGATPRQFLNVRGPVPAGRVSPDGRWMTYGSTESGPSQVFVTSFPDGRGRWPISTTGGMEARWRRDGKELYFLSREQRLMAVPVRTEPRFELGAAAALFDLPVTEYAVAGDGRFLIELDAAPPTSPPITIVLNWTAALKP